MNNLPADNEKKELLAKEKRWEKYYLVKTPLLLKKIYPSYLWSINTKVKILYLTYDDGPNPEITPFVLRQLKRYNAVATFFCIGKNIEKHPEIIKRIAAEGHIVGNHSYSHSHFFDFYRKCRVIQELKETDNLILETTGKKTQFFRPPYGVTNPSIRRAVAVTKHKVIGWNIRSMDGISKNTQAIFNRIVKRLSPGSVVLLHDTRVETNAVLEQLLLSLAEKKYEVVPITELLDLQAYEN